MDHLFVGHVTLGEYINLLATYNYFPFWGADKSSTRDNLCIPKRILYLETKHLLIYTSDYWSHQVL